MVEPDLDLVFREKCLVVAGHLKTIIGIGREDLWDLCEG